jgi:transposase
LHARAFGGAILDSRTLRSSPESGHRAGYEGAKRKKGSKVHVGVDTLGYLLALHVTPADEQDRAQVEELAEAMQEATGESVELAYVDQGYTGEDPAEAAEEHGIRLEVVKRPEAKRGFVLLPRRWVLERDFAWAVRCALGVWSRITSGCLPRWLGCTSSLSRASSFTERSPYSGRVHNTL